MSRRDTTVKRKSAHPLLIIFFMVVLSLLFFVLILKKFDVKVSGNSAGDLFGGEINDGSADSIVPLPTVNPRHVGLVYVINDGRIASCFVQVINAAEKCIFYMEIPMNAKLSLSSELYKELLIYAPNLPQYVKLSRASAYFSLNYRYEGCTKALAENLGVKITDWCVMTEAEFNSFRNKSTSGTYSKDEYWEIFRKYADDTFGTMTPREKWAYYELFEKSDIIDKGVIPGRWDKTDFYITVVQAREKIEELKY